MSYLRKNKEASVHVDEVRELRLGEGIGGQTVLDLVGHCYFFGYLCVFH